MSRHLLVCLLVVGSAAFSPVAGADETVDVAGSVPAELLAASVASTDSASEPVAAPAVASVSLEEAAAALALASPAAEPAATPAVALSGTADPVATPAAPAPSPAAPPATADGPRVKAGVAAAVRGWGQLNSPNGQKRLLHSTDPIHVGDAIRTGLTGSLQILLQDQTVFTLGPRSALTIEAFRLEPGTGKGELKVRVNKGVFRFLSGSIAAGDPQAMQVMLPVGTLGVRGTLVAGRASNERSFVVLLGPGPDKTEGRSPSVSLTYDVNGASHAVSLERAGQGVTVEAGKPPQAPEPVTAGALAALEADLINVDSIRPAPPAAQAPVVSAIKPLPKELLQSLELAEEAVETEAVEKEAPLHEAFVEDAEELETVESLIPEDPMLFGETGPGLGLGIEPLLPGTALGTELDHLEGFEDLPLVEDEVEMEMEEEAGDFPPGEGHFLDEAYFVDSIDQMETTLGSPPSDIRH